MIISPHSMQICPRTVLQLIQTAERCSRIIAKPPSESAVKAWFYNLTNSLPRTMNDGGAFPALFSCRILISVSNCRNLCSALQSFSKDGCTHRVKSVLRLAKRPIDSCYESALTEKLGSAVFSCLWKIFVSKTASSVRQTSGL